MKLPPTYHLPGVLVVPETENKKLRGCVVTYVGQASCPKDCALFGNGCYAEYGPTAWIATWKLRVSAPAVVLAAREAHLLAKVAKDPRVLGRPLRLHVVGDCRTRRSAEIIGEAMRKWRGPSWTYTHAWRNVKKCSWGSASVLASCESVGQMDEARGNGYPTAIVVPEFPEGPKAFRKGGWRIIPCPEQTLGIGCRQCGLCARGDWLFEEKAAIGFTPHGSGAKKVRQVLIQIQENLNGICGDR